MQEVVMNEPLVNGERTSPKAGEFSVESLQYVYDAFTTAILAQKPLQEGRRSILCNFSNCEALHVLDHCISSVDWTSQTPDRDAFLRYFETNLDFIPSMIKIWGIAWDVFSQSSSSAKL